MLVALVGVAPNDGHFNEMIAVWNDVNNDGVVDLGENLIQTNPSEIAYITTQTGMLNLSNVAYSASPAFGTLSLTYGDSTGYAQYKWYSGPLSQALPDII